MTNRRGLFLSILSLPLIMSCFSCGSSITSSKKESELITSSIKENNSNEESFIKPSSNKVSSNKVEPSSNGIISSSELFSSKKEELSSSSINEASSSVYSSKETPSSIKSEIEKSSDVPSSKEEMSSYVSSSSIAPIPSSEEISSSILPSSSIEVSSSEIPSSSIDPSEIYDEEDDSLIGVDEKDLSGLISAANKVGNNYITHNTHYFTESALEYYYINYKKNLPSEVHNVVTNKYIYLYPELDSYKQLNTYNSVIYQKGADVYTANIGEDKYGDLLVKSTFDYSEKLYLSDTNLSDLYFDLSDFTEQYINSHNFIRISKDKYQCSDKDVILDFIQIIIPNFENNGYYMTFDKITIEVNDETDDIFRIRLYSRYTQLGKLITSHQDNINKPNWYSLFAECEISDIGEVSIPCLEN